MGSFDSLLAYHAAHVAYMAARRELTSTDVGRAYSKAKKNLKTVSKDRDTCMSYMDRYHKEYLSLQSDHNDVEARLKIELTALENVDKDNVSQDTVQGMIKRIDALRKEITDLYRRMCDVAKQITDARAAVDKYTADGREKKAEYDKAEEAYRKEEEARKPQFDSLAAEENRLRPDVPHDQLEKYTQVCAVRAYDPVAYLTDANQCSGCMAVIPTMLVSSIEIGTQLVVCETCGRLLFTK